MAKAPLKLPAIKLPVGKALTAGVQALAVFGGVAAGLTLKSGATPASGSAVETGAPAAGDGHGEASSDKKGETEKPAKAAKDKKAKEKKPARGEHGGGHGDAKSGEHGDEASGEAGFMKFSRQFVVPVIDPSGVRSLVVMDINIETPPGGAEATYAREPKLRDAMLAALLGLSNRGAFDQHLLERENLDIIRAELLAAARSVIGDDAANILILNITRQDVS